MEENIFRNEYVFGLPTMEYIKNITHILKNVIDQFKDKKPERMQFAYEMLFRFIINPHILNKLKRELIVEYIRLLERLKDKTLMPDTFNPQYYIDVLNGQENSLPFKNIPSYVKISSYVIKVIKMYENEIIVSENKIFENVKYQIPFDTHLYLSKRMFDYWQIGSLDVFKVKGLKDPNDETRFRLNKTRLYQKDICKKMKKGSYATLWKIRNLLIRESEFDEPSDDTPKGTLLIHECNLHITACMNNMLHLKPNPHFIPVFNQVMDTKYKMYYQTMNYTPITHMTKLTDTFTDDMMFQLLIIFGYMQKNLHIVHNDVHFNNLSVQEMCYTNDIDRFTYYNVGNSTYRINTYKYGLIKLYDFDLACMYDMEIGNGNKVNVINQSLQELSDGFPYYPTIYAGDKINTPFYMFDFLWLLYNLLYEVNIDKEAHLTKYLIHKYLVPCLSYRMLWNKTDMSIDGQLKHPEYVEYVMSHPNCNISHVVFSQIKRKNIKWLCSIVENSPFRYNKHMLLPNKMKIFTDFYVNESQRKMSVYDIIMNDEKVKKLIDKFECDKSEIDESIHIYKM